MSRELEAKNLPLQDVLCDKFEFEIPVYQRPYAWTADNAVQLLEDLLEALERNATEPYFLGSVVLVRGEGLAAEVIDGQQRLTTLTILLAIIRDLVSDPLLVQEIQKHISYTARAYKPGATTTWRLTVREEDRDFFRKHVQTQGATTALVGLTDNAADTDVRRAIRDNAAALRSRLAQTGEPDLTRLFEFMQEHTELVVVSTFDQASAHRIFGVMNARGLPLSPTDIFKVKVIDALPEDKRKAYAEKWQEHEAVLGRDRFTDLFRDIRTVMVRERAKTELLQEFPRLVLDAYLSRGDSAGFVDDVLRPYADAFGRVLRPDFGPGEAWERVNEWLRRLKRYDNNDWRPPALWALRHRSDDPEALNEFFRLLERLAAVSMLRNEYTTPRVKRYLQLLEELDQGHWLESSSFRLSQTEKAEARSALAGDIYRMRAGRSRLVLLRLDDLLAIQSGATYHHKLISVEHVLPQNPRDGSQWRRDFTDEDREKWTHRLGNLVLLNRVRNSEANNREFAAKKKTYFQTRDGGTNFTLTSQVIGEDAWTPAVLERRQAALEKLLVAEWELV